MGRSEFSDEKRSSWKFKKITSIYLVFQADSEYHTILSQNHTKATICSGPFRTVKDLSWIFSHYFVDI